MMNFPSALILTMFIECAVNGVPNCQYVHVLSTDAVYFETNACNIETRITEQGTPNITSFMYVCGDQKDEIHEYQWLNNDGNCTGKADVITNIADDVDSFNCSLPACNDKDNPILTLNQVDSCSDKDKTPSRMYNEIVNQCVVQAGEGAYYVSCNDNPPSLTFKQYANSGCKGPPIITQAYHNGCNDETVFIDVKKCTKPTA
mmetsp:Transcript_3908/g.3384  ORF Transcript_3908/g.3384 Transcript_3908/m.3384 type:complete len:202 (+) Transcript_3908:53-658(+)